MGKNSSLRKISALMRNPLLKSLVYGKLVFTFALILAQIFLVYFFASKLRSYIPYLFGSEALLSVAFLVYMAASDRECCPEYKLAWLLPIIIFPVCGISIYFLTRVQGVPRKIKRRFKSAGRNDSAPDAEGGADSPASPNPYQEIDDIARYLLSHGGFPLHTNCRVDYFPSGEDVFPELLRRIDGARKFIFVEFFIINPGYMWDKILEALARKAEAGVEVRVMYDAFGSMTIAPRSYEKYLMSLKIKAKAFSPMIPLFAPYLNNRDHRKIVVVDGETAFTGGINLSDEYINKTNRLGYWKDTMVSVRGGAVNSFTRMFLQLWNVACGATGEGDARFFGGQRKFYDAGAVIPYCDDAFNKKNIAENVYAHILNTAKRYVHITTPYIVLDSVMTDALAFAAERGVDVSIVVPGRFDHFLTFCIGRTFIKTLMDKGARVYEFTPGFVHAKMFVADDKTAVVGSINLDYRSIYTQFEDALLMHRVSAVADIEADFQKLKSQCVEFTEERYKKIPARMRAIGRVFRLCAPLL